MNDLEQTWYDWGRADALAFPNDHPDQLFQEAWTYFLKNVEAEVESWDQLIKLFPFYQKGILETTKFYN